MAEVLSLRSEYLKERDIQVFRAICEYMSNMSGESPKIRDLVSIVNGYEGLPNDDHRSVANGTIKSALERLESIGLIGSLKGGSTGKRRHGSVRIIDSEFKILISQDEASVIIADHYETIEG